MLNVKCAYVENLNCQTDTKRELCTGSIYLTLNTSTVRAIQKGIMYWFHLPDVEYLNCQTDTKRELCIGSIYLTLNTSTVKPIQKGNYVLVPFTWRWIPQLSNRYKRELCIGSIYLTLLNITWTNELQSKCCVCLQWAWVVCHRVITPQNSLYFVACVYLKLNVFYHKSFILTCMYVNTYVFNNT